MNFFVSKTRFSIAPGLVDGAGFGATARHGRRFSVAPGMEGGIEAPSPAPSHANLQGVGPTVRINLPEDHHHYSDEGGVPADDYDEVDYVPEMMEDDSEILSLQVESVIDTPM